MPIALINSGPRGFWRDNNIPLATIPRYFNGTSSVFEYAANATQVLGAQTLLVQFVPASTANAANIQFLFSSCNSSDANGIRMYYVLGDRVRFGADSTGVAGSPYNGSYRTVSNTGKFYTYAATWNGGLLYTDISCYSSENNGLLVSDTDANFASGSGAINNNAGQPISIGGRPGSTNRIMKGDEFLVARWNRILTLHELRLAQRYGAAIIPNGLVLDWHDGADWGPYGLRNPTITDVTTGAPSIYAPTYTQNII